MMSSHRPKNLVESKFVQTQLNYSRYRQNRVDFFCGNKNSNLYSTFHRSLSCFDTHYSLVTVASRIRFAEALASLGALGPFVWETA